MESYIDNSYTLYTTIIEFLENSNVMSTQLFEKITKILNGLRIDEDRDEMEEFLYTIRYISDNHHRDQNFNRKIEQILQHYKNQIKQTLSNIEIYSIFQNNKIIIYFLLKNGILAISDIIYDEMQRNYFCHFFYPELEKFKGEKEMKTIKDELLSNDENIFNDYDIKRQEGVNDSYICSLIRQDSVEEFIAYVNRKNYSLSSQITPSIFETNSFLIENKETTLIEYSAFYGAIQIFRYLMMNQVELKPSLWLYVIHSKNAELIHLLESEKVPTSKYDKFEQNYFDCLTESIKCHHNDIAEYIETNLLSQEQRNNTHKNPIMNNFLRYHNYTHFKTISFTDNDFCYMCMHNYNKFVNVYLEYTKRGIQSILNQQSISSTKIK